MLHDLIYKSFEFEGELYWAVIAPEDIVVDRRVFHLRPRFLVDQKIIQSPPNALGAAARPHAPPRILDSSGVKLSKCVDPTCL
jgi:hypothetical protein